jgi:hypothetical protein
VERCLACEADAVGTVKRCLPPIVYARSHQNTHNCVATPVGLASEAALHGSDRLEFPATESTAEFPNDS